MHLLILLYSLLFIKPATVYNYSFKTLEGKTVKLSQFKGKKILIVNTASKCGFTPQYKALEELHKQYGKNLVVIGFPSGNFANQELNTAADIKSFCQQNYGVTFLMADKTNVKGDDISPLFQYLTQAPNPDFTGDIKWNFEKFLINEQGKLIHRYRSKTEPLDPSIVSNL